jgi:WD40 repeat protein
MTHGLWVALCAFGLGVYLVARAVAEPKREPFPSARAVLRGHSSNVRSLEFSRDGRRLISVGYDGQVMLWDPVTTRLRQTFSTNSRWLESITLSPDGEVVATSSNDLGVVVWNLRTGEKLVSLPGNSFSRSRLAFLSSGRILLLPNSESLSLLDPSAGSVRRFPVGTCQETTAFAVSRDGSAFARGTDGRVIEVRDTATFRLLARLPSLPSSVFSLVFSPSGRTLALTLRRHPDVILWDFGSGLQRHVHPWRGWLPLSLAFSPDGSVLAVGVTDGTIMLCDPITGRARATVQAHHRGTSALGFSPDGETLASGGAEFTDGHRSVLKLWNVHELLSQDQSGLSEGASPPPRRVH